MQTHHRQKTSALISAASAHGRQKKMRLTLQEALDRIIAADLPSFLDRPIDSVHSRANCGDQPLHIAAFWGDLDLIEAFLGAGADVDSHGEDGFTPLHYAIQQDKVEAARLLIARGANLHLKDSRFCRSAMAFLAASEDPKMRALMG